MAVPTQHGKCEKCVSRVLSFRCSLGMQGCESVPTLCEGAFGTSIHQFVSGASVASGNSPCVTVDKQCLSSYSKPTTALSHLIGGDSL